MGIVAAFDHDHQSLVVIRSLGNLERVFDHVNLGAFGILRRVVPPRLSTFLDREYELVLWVKFPKIFFDGGESQLSRWGRVHDLISLDAGSTGIVSARLNHTPELQLSDGPHDPERFPSLHLLM